MRPGHSALATFSVLVLFANQSRAIRPFVTDDARVVGEKLAQIETWAVIDSSTIEHNLLVAVGPTDWLELTAGFMHGGIHRGDDRAYSLTGPILQAKALLAPAVDNGAPGFAIALGLLPPLGHGPFTPPGTSGFSYVAVTESIGGEALLIHANIGLAAGDGGDSSAGALKWMPTIGTGVQAKIRYGLHGVAEIYFGDPFDPESGYPAAQAGFRYIFSEHVQVDGTAGTALSGERERDTGAWYTIGLRLVSSELW